jgi:acetyl esterase
MGDPQLIDVPARELASDTGCIVVSGAPRLAPEHPYPAPHRDAFEITRWAAEHAVELGGDPKRVAVAGESSGGNLAAGVALRARDEGAPRLAALLLIYPPLDDRLESDSYRRFANGHLLTREAMRQFWERFLADSPADAYAAPARARRLSGLPPTVLMQASHDVLLDEGQRFAQRLQADGVPVHVMLGHSLTHASWYMSGVTQAARAWARSGHQALGVALSEPASAQRDVA